MVDARKSVLEKRLELNGNVAVLKKRIWMINRVLSNCQELSKMTDLDIKLLAIYDRFYSNEIAFKTKLGEFQNGDISSIMGYGEDHLRTIDDPLVRGLVKIYDDDFSVFSFGKVYAPNLLSRFLKRQLPMNDYLDYFSGIVPIAIAKYSSKLYFIERPDNYEELVAEYEQSHQTSFTPLDYKKASGF